MTDDEGRAPACEMETPADSSYRLPVRSRLPAILTAIGFLACVGCGADESVVTESSTASSPQPPPPPATPTDPCDAHRDAFRAAMAEANGSCATPDDCGCFNPVVEEAGCGGITDRAATDRMADIESAFHADSCPWPHQCGPWECLPRCEQGRCVNTASGGRILP